MIPLLDLKRLHASIASDLAAAHARVIERNCLILGPEVEAFEQEFAAYCGVAHCIGTSNGFDAMALALRAAGVSAGDEVIVPAHTHISTWLAVSQVGATPVPVEVQPDTCLIDPNAVEAALTPATRAIIAVHLYGQTAAADEIMHIAERRALFVLEDAAQAHGARNKGRRAGALGHAAAFSFYPSKNLGALGDAGAITTNDEQLAHRLKALRNYGSIKRDINELIGHNARLDEMQAAFLRVKLPFLDSWNAARARLANLYLAAIEPNPALCLPIIAPHMDPVWHLFTLRTPHRQALRAWLDQRGIGSGAHYPTPCYLQPAYAHLGVGRGTFTVSDAIADTIVTLPMDPLMHHDDALEVADAVNEFMKARG